MSTKHTPGPWVGIDPKTKKFRDSPWEAENTRVKSTMAAPIKAGRATVALVVMAGWENKDELHANACLISAAPDLLESAQIFEEYCNAIDAGDYVTAVLLYNEAQAKRRAAIAKATGAPK